MGGGTRVGLALWQSVPATIVIEVALIAAGVVLYARGFRAIERAGRWGLWALVMLLGIIYALNLLGPPPQAVRDIAIVGQAQWLLVLFGWWVDRHRAAPA